MFVITADQVDSRHDVDRADAAVRSLETTFGDDLVLPVDQTAGDEIQAVTPSAATALAMVGALARSGHWSIGLGIGSVRTPLPDAARKATGPAFIGARDAVEAAKRAESRFALRAPDAAERATIIEPLVSMLLLTRARRSEQGWEVTDLMRAGHSQKDAAGILGISAAAVSQRLRAALWRVEDDARSSLEHLLAELDAEASPATRNGTDPTE
ncbi:MAG: SatD family protein [Leifsonia flava]